MTAAKKDQIRALLKSIETGDPGPVGVVTRWASLGYEAVARLTAAGIGQSTFVGMGADGVSGAEQERRDTQMPPVVEEMVKSRIEAGQWSD